MEGRKLVAILVSTLLVSCESAFVDTLKKCSVSDKECQKSLIETVLRDAGKTGIPELGINPIDPLELKGVHLNIFNLIDITLIEGVLKGVKGCNVLKFISNFDTGHASVEILCDISIKGKYKAFSKSELVKSFLGAESVQGEGNGKVKLEKLKISFEYTFDVVKRDNDLYLNCKFDKSKYSFDILGKAHFYADKLYLGKEESSATIVKIMNENWKLIIDSVGKNFMDIAMEYLYDYAKKFFSKVAVKYYIIEDLSSHVVS